VSKAPTQNEPETPEGKPFVAPCRTLEATAPLRWLRLGWADMLRAPRLSLTYGFVLTLMSVAIAASPWAFGQRSTNGVTNGVRHP
jgi:hypothetical protein